MKPKNLLNVLIVILIFSLGLAACGTSGPSTGQFKGEVIVYVTVPLTGFQATPGLTIVDGASLAKEEINYHGGINGYKVILRKLDDQSDDNVAAEQARLILQALQSGEKVVGVIGNLNSGQTQATLNTLKGQSVVVVTPTASEISLSNQGYRSFFRVNADDNTQAQIVGRFILEHLKASRVAVVYNDTIYGRGLGKALKEYITAHNGSIALSLEIKEGQEFYDDEAVQVKAAQAEAIFFAGYEIEAPYLREALVNAGVQVPFVGSDGTFLSPTIDQSNHTANGMFVSAFAPAPKLVASAEWVKAYRVVASQDPDTYSVNGYLAMKLLGDAMKLCNCFDGSQIADTIRGNSFDSLIGKLTYHPNGDLKDPRVWIYQVKNDEFEQVDFK